MLPAANMKDLLVIVLTTSGQSAIIWSVEGTIVPRKSLKRSNAVMAAWWERRRKPKERREERSVGTRERTLANLRRHLVVGWNCVWVFAYVCMWRKCVCACVRVCVYIAELISTILDSIYACGTSVREDQCVCVCVCIASRLEAMLEILYTRKCCYYRSPTNLRTPPIHTHTYHTHTHPHTPHTPPHTLIVTFPSFKFTTTYKRRFYW